MQLHTERLLLHEYTTNDFDAVHAFASDQRNAEFVEWGPNTTADTQDFLETCVSAQIDPERANFTPPSPSRTAIQLAQSVCP